MGQGWYSDYRVTINERRWIMPDQSETIKIDEHEKRFGFVAIEKGFITPDDLISALQVQVKEDTEHKEHRRIGEILVAQGKMREEQIEDVLNALSEDMT